MSFQGPSDDIILTGFSGSKLGPGQSLVFPAILTSPDQKINCYLMCDGIGKSSLSSIHLG